MEENTTELDGLFSDFEDSESSSVSSSSQGVYEEFLTKEVHKISVLERSLSSFNKVVNAIENKNISVPDEHTVFGAYVASECRDVKDKQVLLLLRKKIKDAIRKTKKSLFKTDSEKEVDVPEERFIDNAPAVTKKCPKPIDTHLEDNYEMHKNIEDGDESNEDQEDLPVFNYSDNEDTAKVNDTGMNSKKIKTDEIYIKSEIIDNDCDAQEVDGTVNSSHLPNTRLSGKTQLIIQGEKKQTPEKDIIICSPDIVVDQYRFGKSSQKADNKVTVDKGKANDYQLYKCPDCTKTFLTEARFFAHLQLHISGVIKPSYECKECGKCFTDRGYLYNKHLKVHSGVKNHMCEVCGKCFSTGSHLKGHMLIHDEVKKFGCTICGKLFTHKNHLAMHLRMHRNDKRYKCTICTKSFVAKGNLQQHMLVHVNDKKYCCQECGKDFKHKNAFKMHLLWHSGIKEYICDVCNKGYYTQGKLNVHMKMHNVGMFLCLECGKDFKLKDLIRRHMVIHIGEKNFMCDLCGKCFLHARNLRQHTKSHIHKQMNCHYLM